MRKGVGLLVCVAACGGEAVCPPAGLGGLEEAPAYAVVTSDYQSTAIALLDADGELVTEAWVDSGTTEAGIVATLTGDVSLPTEPWPGELVLIDRFGVDVITRIAVPSGRVIGQVPVRSEPRSGYRPNPQDALRLDAARALVSRFEPNPNAAAPELDRGDDLVVVDLDEGRVVERIDLAHLGVANGGDPIHARPTRMVERGARLIVGLARLSSQWVAGPGAVAIVDPALLSATELPLEGLANCGLVRPVAGDPRAALVLCAGQPFEDGGGPRDAASEATRRRTAGLAIVAVAPDGTAAVTHRWRAADHPDAPVPTTSPVSLGGTRAVVTAAGDARAGMERPDRTFALDLATGDATPVLEAAPFAIGQGDFSQGDDLLLLPDAERGIHRIRAGASEMLAETDPSPCRRLPPRELGAILPL